MKNLINFLHSIVTPPAPVKGENGEYLSENANELFAKAQLRSGIFPQY